MTDPEVRRAQKRAAARKRRENAKLEAAKQLVAESLIESDYGVPRKRKSPEPFRAGPSCPSCGQPIKYKDKTKKLHGWVYRRQVEPMVHSILKTMTKVEAAERTGLAKYTFYEIEHKRVKTVRKDTAAKIVALYKEVNSL